MAAAPRNFKLLEEYDAAIGKAGKSMVKGKHQGMITYGLADDEDMYLSHWKGMIIGIQGKQTGEFLYEFSITVPKSYPESPPIMKFLAPKIAMDCVDAGGKVHINKIQPAFKWSAKCNLADLLMAVRENMASDAVNKASAGLGNTKY
eukprot:CAMPEP_0183348996 /NCGR_PEP_ID=MMETSP0164_2-20130417/13320_1 /TAXON_ID=221442 /ORGANISM="Coccolithus pelagicus ssp braarudi, Strain PLY182g" /LENGTH=146 /DNA_ID=CAMNT_0025520663 /DNA_START=91 /DNA_END=531 /DNA_ORIENTATION=-